MRELKEKLLRIREYLNRVEEGRLKDNIFCVEEVYEEIKELEEEIEEYIDNNEIKENTEYILNKIGY